MTVTNEQLQERFLYRPHEEDTPGQAQAKQTLSEAMLAIAGVVVRMTPSSREQSLALQFVEQSYFWSTAAIDRMGPGS